MRKRMVRLLLNDVTVIKEERIRVHVRFKGGVEEKVLLFLLKSHQAATSCTLRQ